jgi:uroporphyrinogen-III synthase
LNTALNNLGIVITRPWQQAATLAESVRKAGGRPILFPLLEITDLRDYSVFDQTIAEIDKYDWAIFISSNAVQHGMKRLTRIPPTLRFAAIGSATAAALGSFGVKDILSPTGRFDSESLLALPEMQNVAGQNILIFRGVGGREVLANTLIDRGATVSLAECYQRINPSQDTNQLNDLWHNGLLNAFVVTSSEALRNLFAVNIDWLHNVPVFTSHQRIAETAQAHGLQAIMATAAGDEGLVMALEDWAKNRE